MFINQKIKKLLIIILFILLFLLLLVILFVKDKAVLKDNSSFFVKKSDNTSKSVESKLIKTVPESNSEGLYLYIKFVFSEPVTTDMFNIKVVPNTEVKMQVRSQDPNTLLVYPVNPWATDTTYQIILNNSINLTFTQKGGIFLDPSVEYR